MSDSRVPCGNLTRVALDRENAEDREICRRRTPLTAF